MTTTRTTKRTNFNALLALSEVQANPALVDFINHEIELLDKKNSAERKPTAKAVENAGYRDAIIAAMVPGKLYTLSEIAEAVPALNGATPQRMSGLVNTMTTDKGGVIVKVIDKRKAYFQIPAEA